jgi:hypothetical protein
MDRQCRSRQAGTEISRRTDKPGQPLAQPPHLHQVVGGTESGRGRGSKRTSPAQPCVVCVPRGGHDREPVIERTTVAQTIFPLPTRFPSVGSWPRFTARSSWAAFRFRAAALDPGGPDRPDRPRRDVEQQVVGDEQGVTVEAPEPAAGGPGPEVGHGVNRVGSPGSNSGMVPASMLATESPCVPCVPGS